MRKAFWIPAMALALAPHAAQAQAASAGWSWGLIGGMNFSNISGDDGSDMKLDFDAGLTAQKKINAMWSFNVEGHYSMKGAKTSSGGSTATLSLDYIEVPFLFRGGMESGEIKPFIEFGASPAFKVSCKVKAEGSGVVFSSNSDVDGAGKINSFDVGLAGGAGIEWTMMSRPWTLGARYTMGMMKIDDNSDGKNTNIQVLLGFRFR